MWCKGFGHLSRCLKLRFRCVCRISRVCNDLWCVAWFSIFFSINKRGICIDWLLIPRSMFTCCLLLYCYGWWLSFLGSEQTIWTLISTERWTLNSGHICHEQCWTVWSTLYPLPRNQTGFDDPWAAASSSSLPWKPPFILLLCPPSSFISLSLVSLSLYTLSSDTLFIVLMIS